MPTKRKKKRRLRALAKPVVSAVNRIDPTRTVTLRRRFVAEIRRRFALIRGEIVKMLVKDDAFDILGRTARMIDQRAVTFNVFCATGPGGGVDATCSPGGTTKTEKTIEGRINDAIQQGFEKTVEDVKAAEKWILKTVGLEPKPDEQEKPSKIPPVVKDAVKAGAAVVFSGWTMSQALAERISELKGSTPKQAARLRASMATADLLAFKPAAVALGPLGGAVAAATWVIPPVTGLYLAHSTVRHPIKTFKAATQLVSEWVGRHTQTLTNASRYDQIIEAVEQHDHDDWYYALLHAANMDVQLANQIYDKYPDDLSDQSGDEDDIQWLRGMTHNVFCPTGEGGGIDPTCSSSQGTASTPKVVKAASQIVDAAKKLGSDEWTAVRIADIRDELGESYRHEDVTAALWKLHDEGRIHMVHADDPRDETERDRIIPTTRGGQNKYKLYVTNVFCPTGEGGGIDPTCGDGASGGGGSSSGVGQSSDSAASGNGWGRSGAKLKVTPKGEALINKLYNGKLSTDDAAMLAGALPGAEVRMLTLGDDAVEVIIKHADYEATRVLYKDKLENHSFYAETTGTGLGTKIFSQQVAEAVKLGLKRIETKAVRDKRSNGYYTWARLGYDGKVPMGQHGGKKISELMRTPEGRAWWKEHGQSFDGVFDLAEGSQSRRVLDAYNAERQKRVQNVFCPTGEGGGVDPTCGSGESSGRTGASGKVAAELGRLQNQFPVLRDLKEVTYKVHEGKASIKSPDSIGMAAGPDDDLYGVYKHGLGHIDLADYEDIQSAFRHEYGHHVQDNLERPVDPDTGRRMSWQNIYEYGGVKTSEAYSDYHRKTHKEAFADSFARYTSPTYQRGELPAIVEKYFDLALKGAVHNSGAGAEPTKPRSTNVVVKPASKPRRVLDAYNAERVARANRGVANVFCATGEGGGIDPTCGSGKVGNPSSYGSPMSTTELRKVNQNVGSFHDDVDEHGFKEKDGIYEALRSWHNNNSAELLLSYADKHPEMFERMQTVARFNLWKDRGKEGTFEQFLDSEIPIYRGVVEGATKEGRAWSTRRQIADVFSRQGAETGVRATEGATGGTVLEKHIRVRDIFMYSDMQGEAEVIHREPTANKGANDGTRGTTNRAGANAERGGRGDPGRGMGQDWTGAVLTVADVANIFCATGEGGGVDPTCGGDDSTSMRPSLTIEEKDAINSYAGIAHTSLNKALREGAILSKYDKDVHDKLQSAFSKTKQLNDPITVTRGIDTSDQKLYDQIIATAQDALGTDKPLKMPGYQSTTAGESLEKKWAKSNLEIRIGATRGLDISELGYKPNEREILLPHNDSYAVTKIESNGKDFWRGGKTVIYLKQLPASTTTNADPRYQFKTSSEQLRAFQEWLAELYGEHLSIKELMKRYAEEGYKRGIGRAFNDVEKPQMLETIEAPYVPSREQFLRAAFGSPIGQERVEQLASRSFDDLQNVTGDMAARMSRTLLDGLVSGAHPMAIAKGMSKDMDISLGRAETIARTEIIRAHAEGQLDAMEAMGMAQVGVQVEWSTARDDSVCPRCEVMEGVVLDLDKAHGLIPFHPNCRCAFIPAGEPLEVRTVKQAAEDGFDPTENRRSWRSITNVFCPTGEGGGVDPTCSPTMGSMSPQKTPLYKAYRGVSNRPPNDHGVAGRGEYWSGSRQVAEAYAPKRDNGVVKEGTIQLEKALVMSYPQLTKLQVGLYGRPLTGFEQELSIKFDGWLREKGYDGVVLFDEEISKTIPQEIVKLAPRKVANGRSWLDVVNVFCKEQ